MTVRRGLKNKSRGLNSPKKYIKTVQKRRKLAKVVNTLAHHGTAVIPGGLIVAGHKVAGGKGATVGFAAGMVVAFKLHIAIGKKGSKITYKTLAEISGRPKLAERVAKQVEKKDSELAANIRRYGRDAPKLNKAQREEFLKNKFKGNNEFYFP